MARSSQVHRAVLIGLALTVALALLCGLQRLSAARWLDPVDTVERLSLDVRFKLRGPVPARGDVVLVAFDDRTLERAPDLFELRSGTARVLAAIDRAKPAVVGLDLLFADPERLLSSELSDRIKALVANPPAGAASVERALLEEVAGELRGDERLAAAMEGGHDIEARQRGGVMNPEEFAQLVFRRAGHAQEPDPHLEAALRQRHIFDRRTHARIASWARCWSLRIWSRPRR